mmetsp:Transcript_13634/g.21783  ORF Transcript_13634/g.21783 Transcript_13634/m.21783 type:complete len:323 (+) Transcript_13634:1-969(+)
MSVKQDETFKKAMQETGYDGIYFVSPAGGGGLSTWWDRNVFTSDLRNDCLTLSVEGYFPDGNDPSALNFDLREHWHKVNSKTKSEGGATIMNREDRRNCGMVRLTHKHSKKAVWIVAAHLMTTSRDKSGKVVFPGEVRAGELATMKRECPIHIKKGESVILAGDFNTQPHELELFTGNIPPAVEHSGKTALKIDTGFDSKSKRFLWPASWVNCPKTGEKTKASDNREEGGGEKEANHRRSSPEIKESIRLQDAFADVHKFKKTETNCTSRSAARTQWIDYIWYSYDNLELVSLSDTKAPQDVIPNEDNPSDHIPIGCTLRFR